MQFPVFEFIRAKIWDWRNWEPAGAKQALTHERDGQELQEKMQPVKGKPTSLMPVLLETGLVNGTSAALSEAVAAVLTTPTDVVKTRMMLMAGRGAESVNKARRGGWQVFKLIYRERGIKGLFRGVTLRAGWTAVGSGLYLGTYEVVKVWLRGL
jgi:hypothetical protein